MSCDHCLRGEAQNRDIDFNVIDVLLDQVSYISEITFTGGEPSLNIKAMQYFLDQCTIKNIEIGNFYICTNGLKVNDDFLLFVLSLYSYCSDNEISSVAVSRSDYHWGQDQKGIDKLKAFSFFHERGNLNYDNLINEGRAKEMLGEEGRKNKICDLTIEHWDNNINVDGDFYVNVKGDIVTNCDLSYKRQDKHKIGNILNESLKDIINKQALIEV